MSTMVEAYIHESASLYLQGQLRASEYYLRRAMNQRPCWGEITRIILTMNVRMPEAWCRYIGHRMPPPPPALFLQFHPTKIEALRHAA